MLDSRAKLSLTLFFSAVALCLPPLVRLAGIALTVLFVIFSASFKPYSAGARDFFRRFLLYSALLSAVVLLVNGILVHEGGRVISIAGISLFSGGLLVGTDLASRLLLLSFAVLLYFVSTSIREIAAFLERSPLPSHVASVVLLSLYFVQQIPRRIATIHAAQESRGAELRGSVKGRAKSFISVLGPLVVSSLVESVERGNTLELRGFFLPRKRARERYESNGASLVCTGVAVAATMAVVAWRLLNG